MPRRGGLSVAHETHVISLKGKKAPVVDGFSSEQRFFLAWYDAFGIKPGDKLYLDPKDRVHIW